MPSLAEAEPSVCVGISTTSQRDCGGRGVDARVVRVKLCLPALAQF